MYINTQGPTISTWNPRPIFMARMAPSHDLSSLSQRSLEFLTSLKECLSSACIEYQRLDDIQQRFRLWSGNIGALHPPWDPKSLEYRVRTVPKLEARFAELLGDLREDLDECQAGGPSTSSSTLT